MFLVSLPSYTSTSQNDGCHLFCYDYQTPHDAVRVVWSINNIMCVQLNNHMQIITPITFPFSLFRYISGFFYRAHSPNWDRFNIRPGYFLKDPTYPFKFSFEDYLEMPEYQNILVKMFSRDLL
jgi:hypothetical protein